MDISSGFEGQLAKSVNEPSMLFAEGYDNEAFRAQSDNQASKTDVDSMLGDLHLTETTRDPDGSISDRWKIATHTNRNDGSGGTTNERDALLDRRLG